MGAPDDVMQDCVSESADPNQILPANQRNLTGDGERALVVAVLYDFAEIARLRQHTRGGRLINSASGQARQGFIHTPHYAASKFGVVGITQSLAKEVAKEGTPVIAFCPGIIDTDMWAYNDADVGRAARKQ